MYNPDQPVFEEQPESNIEIAYGIEDVPKPLWKAVLFALQTYHFSNEGVCSWYDFTVAIHRLAGITTCKVKPLHTAEYPAKANRPAYSVLDKTKIKTTFDIEIPHWEESLKQCLIKLGMKNEE